MLQKYLKYFSFCNRCFNINLKYKQAIDNKIASPKEVLAIEYNKEPEAKEERPPSPPPQPEPVKVETPAVQPPPDLLVITVFYFAMTFVITDGFFTYNVVALLALTISRLLVCLLEYGGSCSSCGRVG
jgi:hypothetical protein